MIEFNSKIYAKLNQTSNETYALTFLVAGLDFLKFEYYISYGEISYGKKGFWTNFPYALKAGETKGSLLEMVEEILGRLTPDAHSVAFKLVEAQDTALPLRGYGG